MLSSLSMLSPTHSPHLAKNCTKYGPRSSTPSAPRDTLVSLSGRRPSIYRYRLRNRAILRYNRQQRVKPQTALAGQLTHPHHSRASRWTTGDVFPHRAECSLFVPSLRHHSHFPFFNLYNRCLDHLLASLPLSSGLCQGFTLTRRAAVAHIDLLTGLDLHLAFRLPEGKRNKNDGRRHGGGKNITRLFLSSDSSFYDHTSYLSKTGFVFGQHSSGICCQASFQKHM